MTKHLSLAILLLSSIAATAQQALPKWESLFNGKDLTGWIDVNTSPETWSVKDGVLICHGQPIGVMRSAKQYENFVLHIEWKHIEAGGNSGVFVWSDGTMAGKGPYPKAVEVQMLELDWPKLHPEKTASPVLSNLSMVKSGESKAYTPHPTTHAASVAAQLKTAANPAANGMSTISSASMASSSSPLMENL